MTRFRIGAGILLMLLAFGFGVQLWMDAACTPIAEALTASQTAARAGRWDRAEALRQEAAEGWYDHWHCFAAFADHQPMEEIDGLLAQLAVYAREQSAESYAAAAADLTRRIAAMSDAHRFRWWNLL